MRGDGKIEIAFEHTEQKTLAHSISQQHLSSVQRDSVADHHALRDPRHWRTLALPPDKRVKAAARKKCDHCGKLLKTPTFSAARDWKSCPKCSTVDGHQHVYYEYPSAFGPTEAGAVIDKADVAQGYCVACRGGETPTAASTGCASIAVMPR